MKSTIKVAELASFMYAILLFGSFCINAVYYSTFGIDISAYMTLSEILLLFLGQPVLYIPILLSIAWIALISRYWVKGPCSIHRVYDSIARTNDVSFLILSVVLLVLIKVWYDLPLNPSLFGLLCLFYLGLSFLPSLMNASFRSASSASRSYRKETARGKDKLTPPVKRKVSFKQVLKSFKRRFSHFWSSVSRKWKNRREAASSRTRDLTREASVYRLYIKDSSFSRSTISRLRWIYNNPFVYSFILVSCVSMVLMTSANYWLAKGIKEQMIIPSRTVSFTYEDQVFPTDSTDLRLFIGESLNYLFLYNPETETAEVYPRTGVKYLSFHVSHPSDTTMKRRLIKGLKELQRLDSGLSEDDGQERDSGSFHREAQQSTL